VIYAYYKGVQAIKQGRRKEGNRGDLCQPKDPAAHHRKAGRNVLLDQLLQPERVMSILLALKARRDQLTSANGFPNASAKSASRLS
jgi:hypothetical protein